MYYKTSDPGSGVLGYPFGKQVVLGMAVLVLVLSRADRLRACDPCDPPCEGCTHCESSACVAGCPESSDPCAEVECVSTGSVEWCKTTYTCGGFCLCPTGDCPEYLCIADVCEAISCTGPSCCDDGNPCTVDTCVSGTCENTGCTSDACCDDGDPCTTDTCDANGVCHNDPKCPEGQCCYSDGTCVPKCGGWCLDPGEQCCGSGSSAKPYNPAFQVCCNVGDQYCAGDGDACCYLTPYDSNTHDCCGEGESAFVFDTSVNRCCSDKPSVPPYYLCSVSQDCCRGYCYWTDIEQCCVTPAGNGMPCPKYDTCCGTTCCPPPCCDTWVCHYCDNTGCHPCLSKPSTWEELQACSAVVPDPLGPPPCTNGCTAVPNNIPPCAGNAGLISCLPSDCQCPQGTPPGPCDNHDYCYGTCGSDKDTCDSQFRSAMHAVCAGIADPDCRNVCDTHAEEYYWGVHELAGYWHHSAQVTACACCACYLAG